MACSWCVHCRLCPVCEGEKLPNAPVCHCRLPTFSCPRYFLSAVGMQLELPGQANGLDRPVSHITHEWGVHIHYAHVVIRLACIDPYNNEKVSALACQRLAPTSPCLLPPLCRC